MDQREGVIAELRDEASTLWASGWLSFRRKAWGNQNLTGKMTLGCPRLTYRRLPILRLFLSFFFTLVAFGPCNDDFDLY